jgi:hypothetical protein
MKQWGEWVTPEDAPAEGLIFNSATRQAIVAPDGATRVAAQGVAPATGERLMSRLGKRQTGRLIDGALHDNYPSAAAAH